MRFSNRFNKDFNYYLYVRHTFNFDGCNEYFSSKGVSIIQSDIKGVNGKEAFYLYDSQGVIKPTKHPNILHTLLKVKGSINLHIKMFAEDRAKGYLPKILLDEMNLPDWIVNAIEKQKFKYY
jgi:hypothetical protein